MKHLFLYFDNRAAHDMTLLFHLADVRLRHNVNQAVGVRVHLDQKAFKKFEEIVNGEDFLDKLEKARRNSKSAEAREIVSRVLPVANLTSRTVGWSAQERAAEHAQNSTAKLGVGRAPVIRGADQRPDGAGCFRQEPVEPPSRAFVAGPRDKVPRLPRGSPAHLPPGPVLLRERSCRQLGELSNHGVARPRRPQR